MDRDRKIIKWTWKLRFCTSEHLRVLCGIPRWKNKEEKQEHPKYRSLQRRLRQLWIAGYLVRPPEQVTAKLQYPELTHLVYGLGKKANQELGKQGINVGKVNWTRKNQKVRSPFIAHQLALTDFHVAIYLATADRQDLELTRWFREGKIDDEVLYEGKEYRVKPDSYLTLKDPKGKMYFCLEADMATVTHKRMAQRFRAYTYWWKKDYHIRHYGMNRNFRVLILCLTDKRKEALRKLAKRTDELGTGLNLFWFASQKDYDYHKPETVFKKIFTTPRDETPHSILERHI